MRVKTEREDAQCLRTMSQERSPVARAEKEPGSPTSTATSSVEVVASLS